MLSSDLLSLLLLNIVYAQDCTLSVPANPLTPTGLSTPYVVSGLGCDQSSRPSFVEATILDKDTGNLFVYHPLVITAGTTPAIDSVIPVLPPNAEVGIWFGSNADSITLIGDGAIKCVNGLKGSIFSQFAYCNGKEFFASANQAIARGLLKVPQLGTGSDGTPCPTTRDFRVVDQDQSDNVVTSYLINENQQTAQNTAANRAALPGATEIDNGSDNRLVDDFIDVTLNCKPFLAPSLDDPGTMSSSLALDELLAAANQRPPIALVPLTDPMVLVNNQQNLQKLNLYREGVNQKVATNAEGANGKSYCRKLVYAGIKGLNKPATRAALSNGPTLNPALGNNLFNFLAARSNASLNNLNCLSLLKIKDPWILTTDGNGVVISATTNISNFDDDLIDE